MTAARTRIDVTDNAGGHLPTETSCLRLEELYARFRTKTGFTFLFPLVEQIQLILPDLVWPELIRRSLEIVAPKYTDRLATIEFDRLSSSLLAGAQVALRYAGRPYLDVQDFGSATLGKPRVLRQLTVLRPRATASHCAAPLSAKRLKLLTRANRIFWVWLRRIWNDWKSVLMIVKVEPVIAWP